MAKKSQCEQCDAFIKERELCRKNWELVQFDDTECEHFGKRKNQFATEGQEASQPHPQNNRGNDTYQSGVTVSEVGLGHLLEIAKWTKILAIIATIGILLLAVLLLIVSIERRVFSAFFGIIMIIAIYYYPIKKAFDMASNMKSGALQKDSVDLEYGLNDLRSILKYIGIMSLIVVTFNCLTYIAAFFIGLSRGAAS